MSTGLTKYDQLKNHLTLASTPSDEMSLALRTHEGKKTMRETGLAIARENGRAAISFTAMQNTSMLVVFGDMCVKMAPNAEEYCAMIIRNYAAGAAMKIMRF